MKKKLMKNKVGYVELNSKVPLMRIEDIMKEIKGNIKVDFCITNIRSIDKKWVEFELYSNEKSWQQEYTTDGLIHSKYEGRVHKFKKNKK